MSGLTFRSSGSAWWPGWLGLCGICRQIAHERLCPACLQRHAAARWRCTSCALAVPGDATPQPAWRCGACVLKPPLHGRAIAAVDYGFPWDGLLARFKYHQQAEWARALAPLLRAAVQRAYPDASTLPQALLPVPLSPRRLAERGYNQAWELARRLAPALHRPAWADLLQRPLDTRAQAGSTRAQRQGKLGGAFWVPPAAATRLAGLHLALVDDVLTTGATAAACTQELLRAGAARVDVWVLARTPEPGA
jgi:ComF family protein